MAYTIFESARDSASAGHGMVTTLAVAVGVVGVLMSQVGRVAVPAVAPLVIPQAPAILQQQVTYDGDRRVIADGQGTRSNRCDVPGYANDVTVTFEIDTGGSNPADFSSSYVRNRSCSGRQYNWYLESARNLGPGLAQWWRLL
jgi:hypothetical protein